MGVIIFLGALFLYAGAPLSQHTIHTDTVDYFAPNGIVGARADMPRLAIDCAPNNHTFQFIWRAAEGETTDQAAVQARLTAIAEQVNYMFWLDSNSDTEYRLPAWQMTADCQLDILYVGPDATIEPPPDNQRRKQIIIEESVRYCGVALLFGDEEPGPENRNNLSTPMWVVRGCLSPYVVAHEMLHSMGAVQLGAPNSDGNFHTLDFGDVMARPQNHKCGRFDIIDCNKDDYWSLTPVSGSYLAEKWNSANSLYLISRPKYRVILQPIFYTGR